MGFCGLSDHACTAACLPLIPALNENLSECLWDDKILKTFYAALLLTFEFGKFKHLREHLCLVQNPRMRKSLALLFVFVHMMPPAPNIAIDTY